MTQFYTVIIEKRHVISKFDERGRKIGETETTVEQTIADLPWQTAQMYQQKTPSCRIIKQDMAGFGDKRNHRVRFGDTKTGKSQRAEPTKLDMPVAKKPTAAPGAGLRKAAETGDLAAAINAGEAA
jgi:hypothetical protein